MAGGAGISGGSGDAASSFLGMVALLSDPAKLEAAYEQLQQAQAAAQAVIDLAGPASEIIEIRKQLGDAQTNIANQMTAAQDQANAIIAAANKEAQRLVDNATAHAEAIRQAAADVASQADHAQAMAKAAQAQADATLEEANAHEAAAKALAEAAQSHETDLAAREAALAAKAQSLVDAHATIAKAIASIPE